MGSFRLFLDYDVAGSRVVGESVRAVSDDVEDVCAYAVLTPEADLLMLHFNRDVAALEAQVSIAVGADATGRWFRFDPSSPLSEIGPKVTSPGPSAPAGT